MSSAVENNKITRNHLINKLKIAAGMAAGMILCGVADAALIDRGGGLIYDTDLDLTWVSDANLAMTSGFDSDGLMGWYQAASWIQSLNDSIYLRGNGWRLPHADVRCGGNYNCINSEMGHLFYSEFGESSHNSLLSSSSPYLSLFTGINNAIYWSDTVVPASDGDDARFDFFFGSGWQDGRMVTTESYAWAVHDGDIGAVPLPAAAYLFGSGLLGLVGMSRRKASRSTE